MSERIIICEGFHDRAFWAGLLTHLRCEDLAAKKTRPIVVYDPQGKQLRGGQYGFHSITGQFIRVVPAGSDKHVFRSAEHYLKGRSTRPVSHVVTSVDGDTGTKPERILQLGKLVADQPSLKEDGDVEIDDGATKISLVRWETTDSGASGLPSQQTLERLVSAAIVAAYPNRSGPVDAWLKSRPDPPNPHPKEHALSYAAGWYAEFGGLEGLYREVWQDPKVATELVTLLDACGALRIARAIAE